MSATWSWFLMFCDISYVINYQRSMSSNNGHSFHRHRVFKGVTTLKNRDGALLKVKYNVSQLKPYVVPSEEKPADTIGTTEIIEPEDEFNGEKPSKFKN